MLKELENLNSLKDMLIGNGCNDYINDYVDNLILPIKQALLEAQKDHSLKCEICEMFGLDNLFPYNDPKAILKELEEYMEHHNEIWFKYMKKSKKEQAWDIAVKRRVDLWNLKVCSTVENYNKLITKYEEFKNCILNEEEFDLLKSELEELE